MAAHENEVRRMGVHDGRGATAGSVACFGEDCPTALPHAANKRTARILKTRNDRLAAGAIVFIARPTLAVQRFHPTTCPPALRTWSAAPEQSVDPVRPGSRQGSRPSSRGLFLECETSNGDANARLDR